MATADARGGRLGGDPRTVGRAGKATAVGPTPGVTKSVLGAIKVLESPRTYLIDTPGVLVPRIDDVTVGLKLAVTGARAGTGRGAAACEQWDVGGPKPHAGARGSRGDAPRGQARSRTTSWARSSSRRFC